MPTMLLLSFGVGLAWLGGGGWLAAGVRGAFGCSCSALWALENPGAGSRPYWTWQPTRCELEEVTAAGFCRVMEGRKGLLLVGERDCRCGVGPVSSCCAGTVGVNAWRGAKDRRMAPQLVALRLPVPLISWEASGITFRTRSAPPTCFSESSNTFDSSLASAHFPVCFGIRRRVHCTGRRTIYERRNQERSSRPPRERASARSISRLKTARGMRPYTQRAHPPPPLNMSWSWLFSPRHKSSTALLFQRDRPPPSPRRRQPDASLHSDPRRRARRGARAHREIRDRPVRGVRGWAQDRALPERPARHADGSLPERALRGARLREHPVHGVRGCVVYCTDCRYLCLARLAGVFAARLVREERCGTGTEGWFAVSPPPLHLFVVRGCARVCLRAVHLTALFCGKCCCRAGMLSGLE